MFVCLCAGNARPSQTRTVNDVEYYKSLTDDTVRLIKECRELRNRGTSNGMLSIV